jgi:hypothetical protein
MSGVDVLYNFICFVEIESGRIYLKRIRKRLIASQSVILKIEKRNERSLFPPIRARDSAFTPFPVSKVGILSNGNAESEMVFWIFHCAVALDFLPAEPHFMGSHGMIETICCLIRKSDHIPLKACIQNTLVG